MSQTHKRSNTCCVHVRVSQLVEYTAQISCHVLYCFAPAVLLTLALVSWSVVVCPSSCALQIDKTVGQRCIVEAPAHFQVDNSDKSLPSRRTGTAIELALRAGRTGRITGGELALRDCMRFANGDALHYYVVRAMAIRVRGCVASILY